jgi:hypothetical protein
MAIEDEIINISDIDVGTEILNTDQLIIETNNGTKLLKFKDFVISEENITFKDKLVQGNRSGKSTTQFDTVTGYNILTSDTTAGHLTKYSDISGTVELGRFNYNGVSEFAKLSATINQNESKVDNLQIGVNEILERLGSTDSSALNSITLTLSSVNFRVAQLGDGGTSSKQLRFSTTDLDPSSTNPNVTFTNSPFSIKYPSTGYNDSYILFMFDGVISGQSGSSRRPLYLTVDGVTVYETTFAPISPTKRTYHRATINYTAYIKQGQTVQLRTSSKTLLNAGATFAGVKLS